MHVGKLAGTQLLLCIINSNCGISTRTTEYTETVCGILPHAWFIPGTTHFWPLLGYVAYELCWLGLSCQLNWFTYWPSDTAVWCYSHISFVLNCKRGKTQRERNWSSKHMPQQCHLQKIRHHLRCSTIILCPLGAKVCPAALASLSFVKEQIMMSSEGFSRSLWGSPFNRQLV